MKRIGRWLAIVAVVVVALLIAGFVLVKLLVTPERVRATLVPLAEKALQRPVALGEINIGLFSGVQVANLEIGEPDGRESFVAADKVVLRYRFWPLLRGQVVIDEARLVGPKIRIVRLADGRFNFDDLVAAPPAGSETPAAPASPGSGTPIDLSISRVAIEGGEVVFLDYRVDAKAPYRLKFSAIGLELQDVSLTRSFPFELQARINDAQLEISGDADLGARKGNAHVRLTDLDVTGFAPYLRGHIPGTLGALKVSTDLTLAGDASQLTSRGELTLANLDLTLDALPDAPLRQARLGLDYAIRLDPTRQQLAIDKGHFTFNGIAAELSGSVADYGTTPRVDLQLALPALDLRQALDALPPGLVAATDGLDPAGKLDLQAHLAGTTDHPEALLQEGSLRLSAVQASLAGLRPALNGSFALKGGALSSQGLQLVAGDNRADLDLKVANLFARPLVVSLKVSADRLLLDPLVAAGNPPPDTPAADAPPSPPATEAGPLDLPLTADVTMTVKKTIYQGLECQDLFLHGTLVKNILQIDSLRGNLAGGNFTDTARIDLGRPGFAYRTHLVLTDIELEPLVGALQPEANGKLSGTIALVTDLAGNGTLPATIRRELSGNGEVTLRNGRLDGGELARGLATVLGLDELQRLTFQQWDGNFRIEAGKVKFDSRFSGGQLRLSPQGSVGLDGSLNVVLDTRVAPELTAKLDQRGKVSSYFKDADGWGQLPLKLSGNIDKPHFEIDARAATRQAGEKLQQKLEQKLIDKLGPKEKGEPAGGTDQKKLLEESIRGLFKN
ncbi:hypothetical protein JCM30471_11130 [Desulfuromonas carbonis]|uniref:DUF748 domain-containing protein n=1 Tax=Desulfuromonas sp. DDH964 TaxID=1823759 RepID=UPI00078E808D|nr:AsmA family protein [Desulfuromonas sp. DDH964]AMV72594.1 hypothetical protein DBW_2254 [Desulfuromonas sp. DDH964]